MELAVTRVVPLWVGARGVEFDWKYIQMSFDANISLVSYHDENIYIRQADVEVESIRDQFSRIFL